MLETCCVVGGQYFKLKYRKLFAEGESFKGLIFLKSAIPVSYKKLDEGAVLFEPDLINSDVKNAIIDAIKDDQLLE